MKNLNKLYWIKKEIKQIEERIKELTVLSAVNFSGMPSSNTVSSPVEKFNERLDKLNRKLVAKLIKSLEEEERIEDYIETIDDVEIRVLARARFIECKSWQKIGDENHMDRTTAYKKLNKYIRERNEVENNVQKSNKTEAQRLQDVQAC